MADQTTTESQAGRRTFASVNDSKNFNTGKKGVKTFNKNGKAGPKMKKRSLEVFEKYFKDKNAIKNVSFLGKYCFSVKTVSDDFKKSFEQVVEASAPKAKAVDFNWIVSHYGASEEELAKAAAPVENWRETLGEETRFASYGEVDLTVDFTKLNLLKDNARIDENILYPYGVFFFSDETQPASHLRAAVACFPDRFNRMKFNNNFEPITDYENVKLSGQFRSHGRFVIFFVGSEAYDEEKDIYIPDVTTICIDVAAEKKDGVITKISVIDSFEITKAVNAEEGQDFSSYIANEVYYRYVTPFGANTHTIADYLYIIGSDPRTYNLAIPETPKFEKALAAIEEKKAAKAAAGNAKSEKSSDGKKKGGKKGGKKAASKEKTETVATEEKPVDVDVESAAEEEVTADNALDFEAPASETANTEETSVEGTSSEENNE